MRVLFVLKASVMFERMGAMYLISALKKTGHDTRLVLAEKVGVEGLKNILREFNPRLVCYSIMTGEHIGVVELNRKLKEDSDFLAVFGGPHPTFFDRLIHEDGVDAVCVGEGDLALPEFCRALEAGGNYWETPNFLVKREGRVYNNRLMPLICDLDELPFPDRSAMYEANPELIETDMKVFFSSRGCPYTCSYCFNRRYNKIYKGLGSAVRYRSARNVVEEIMQTKDHYPAMKMAGFADDAFLLKPAEWFSEFAGLYKAKVGLPFSCHVRANQVRDEVISVLKDAGLCTVWMGVECGDEVVANEVLNRHLSNEQLVKAADIFHKYNINLVTQNILGLPVEDSYEVDLKTLELNVRLKPKFAWSSILYPYPGTAVAEYARKKGFIKGDVKFLETNKKESVLDFGSEKTKRKIENLHKLFGLMVQSRVLRSFKGVLCNLPPNRLYLGLFYMWYGYNVKAALNPSGSLFRGLGNYANLWWKYINKKS